MRAILYDRVSTEDQRLCLPELRAFALARGDQVVAEIAEKGSGARANRPGLKRTLELCHQREGDVVYIRELSRLSRVDVADLTSIVKRIKLAGVRLVCMQEPIDVGGPHESPYSEIIVAVLGACAKIARTQMVERTKMGMAAARARGAKVGRPRRELDVGALLAQNVNATPAELAKILKCGEVTVRRRLHELGLQYVGPDGKTPRSGFKKGSGSWRPIPVETPIAGDA